MKKSIIYFTLTILIIVYFSECKKTVNTRIIEAKFESRHNVMGKEISLSADIFSPKIMLLLADATIAVTEKQDEYALRILKLGIDSVYLADKLGRIGQGPDDVASSINSLQKDSHNLDNGMWLADFQSMKFYRYMADFSTLEDTPSDVKKIPPQVFPCSKSFVLKNSGILGMSTAINSQVFIYSYENDALKEYNFYPVIPNPYELSEPVYIRFDDVPFPQFDAVNQQTNRETLRNLPLQYINLYTTDNYIYVLYANKKGDEMENHSSEALQGVSIHVFNWNGMALCSLNLDRIVYGFGCMSRPAGCGVQNAAIRGFSWMQQLPPETVPMENKDTINCLNHFPANHEHQCFLLDKNNKVRMLGNPTLFPKL
ncbi:MAG: TolB-like 6-bladed beta-propeller domain-containing protein [Prevotellaceae bacterium]|jgi:hypothetical protein|nr:TolB-like 6-bladed beta-propeller domain-containing protein [Prevotellaceae bacterium]